MENARKIKIASCSGASNTGLNACKVTRMLDGNGEENSLKKKTGRFLTLFLTLTVIVFTTNCAGDPTSSGNKNSNGTEKAKYKVTFIELGSVRCIPCQQMQPIIKSITEKYGKQVNVVFHDVWTEAGAPYAKQYGIEEIPTQVFLDKDGKEYFRHVGFFPEEEVIKILKQKKVK